MPPIPDRPHLTISSICKSFGSTPVLKNISLTIHRGEFITLLGPSGCGKTTLLRILAGLELADSGTITLAGNDLLSLPAHRRPVNTVFQNYALFPHLNVTDNIAFGLRSRRIAESEIQPRVREALQMLQLEEFATRPIHQLSGGQKQRVAVARAVVNQPELLLLDEPMSALDAKLRAQVQVELRALHRRLGTTFILVTHDQTEALTVSDRLFVMHQGQIAQSGTPHEIYNHPQTRFVAEFLGTTNLIHTQSPDAKPLTLAIRPEHIQITTDSPTALPATIQEIIFRGDHQELFVETCATTESCAMPSGAGAPLGMPPQLPNSKLSLRVRAPASHSYSLHQTIHLHLPQDHLEVLHG